MNAKKSFVERIRESAVFVIDMFREYPFTLGTIMVLAVVNMIFIDNDYSETVNTVYEYVNVALVLFGAQSLFCEEYFFPGRSKRCSSMLVCFLGEAAAIVISIAGAFLMRFKQPDSYDYVSDFSERFFTVYLVCLVLTAIYHMYKRLEDEFEVYCRKAFCGITKCTLVYSIFAIGIGIITLIFDTLIMQTDSFIMRAEIFLAAGVYAPMLLASVSEEREETGKFAKNIFLYVLEPLLMVAFVIIYIYIIKIVVNVTLPSNEVFGILAFLYSIGMPIWTLAMSVNNTEYENKMSLIAKYLPYAYIPFIVLECICIGIRINAYGITEERYFAVAFIVFQVLYFALYIVGEVRKKSMVSLSLFVASAMAVVMFVLPFVNVYDSSARSQIKRLQTMLSIENPTEEEQKNMYNIYRAVKRMGAVGKEALDENISESDMERITSEYDTADYHEHEITVNFFENREDIDISGYSNMIKIEGNYHGSDLNDLILTDKNDTIAFCPKDYIEDVIEEIKDSENYYNSYTPEKIYVVDNITGFIPVGGYIYLDGNGEEVEDCFVEGYLFMK